MCRDVQYVRPMEEEEIWSSVSDWLLQPLRKPLAHSEQRHYFNQCWRTRWVRVRVELSTTYAESRSPAEQYAKAKVWPQEHQGPKQNLLPVPEQRWVPVRVELQRTFSYPHAGSIRKPQPNGTIWQSKGMHTGTPRTNVESVTSSTTQPTSNPHSRLCSTTSMIFY